MGLFIFSAAKTSCQEVEDWFAEHEGELGDAARRWFNAMRSCGNDVRELLHDGHPTACVSTAAFGYVDAFKAHVNVGFYRGAELPDPNGILLGQGKLMRHVKVGPKHLVYEEALEELVSSAYQDMKRRLDRGAFE